ncbi:DUF5655 domain-containing protein [Sinomonas mesophila]|uniref:DUF5655 domain-containing protein n=1 Tax=Sinomonas mesophila TaxID=1531955 RepID=UPI000987B348|nr:DUF5655 domain-containing protein [Sinomonas mesophila]
MGPGDSELAGLWICPRCGARLVSRNLWHSCGLYSLEQLLSHSDSQVLRLGRACVAMLESLGDVQVLPQKTRLVCVARVRFAGLQPRKHDLLLSFALRRWLDSPRIVKTESYGPRWFAHSVRIGSLDDVDEELRGWLQESHDTVGLQRDS